MKKFLILGAFLSVAFVSCKEKVEAPVEAAVEAPVEAVETAVDTMTAVTDTMPKH